MTDERSDIEAALKDRVTDIRHLDDYDLGSLPDDELAPAILLRHGTTAVLLFPERFGDGGMHIDIRAYVRGEEVGSTEVEIT